MADLYEELSKRHRDRSVWLILDGPREVVLAKVHVFYREGSATCYFHCFGSGMVKARVTGHGYDRATAAVEKAAAQADAGGIAQALLGGHGRASWDRRLRDAGFRVIQAV